MYSRKAMSATIEDYVVNPRYREILRLRYCEGVPYERIGEITNYSTQHVKSICNAYKDELISRL